MATDTTPTPDSGMRVLEVIEGAMAVAARYVEEHTTDRDVTAFVIAIPVDKKVLSDPDFDWKKEAKDLMARSIDRMPSPVDGNAPS